MKFSPLGFREVLTTGRGTAPKSRMEPTSQLHSFTNKVRPYSTVTQTDLGNAPNKDMYVNAKRMNRESEPWYTTEEDLPDVHVGGDGGGLSATRAMSTSGVRRDQALLRKSETPYVRSSSAYGMPQARPASTASQLSLSGGTAVTMQRAGKSTNSALERREDDGRQQLKEQFGRKTADFNVRQGLASNVGMAALSGGIPSRPAPLTAASLRVEANNSHNSTSKWETDQNRRRGWGGDQNGGGFEENPEEEVFKKQLANFDPIFARSEDDLSTISAEPRRDGMGQNSKKGTIGNAAIVGGNGWGPPTIAARQNPSNRISSSEDVRCIGVGGYQNTPLFKQNPSYPRPDQLRQPYATSAAGRALPASNIFADPTLGVGVSMPMRGPNPVKGSAVNSMYLTSNAEAFGASKAGDNNNNNNRPAAGVARMGLRYNQTNRQTDFGDRPAYNASIPDNNNTGGMLAYDERWVPPTKRHHGRGDGYEEDSERTKPQQATAVATTTQGGVPLVNGHTADERRQAHAYLSDNVVQRVGGPPPTSIGAAALEAIRKEKRYRTKISKMVEDLEAECAAVGGRLGAATPWHQQQKRGNNNNTNISPLVSAGGPVSKHAQMLERLDTIQSQIRARIVSRAGPASTYEQQVRALQSLLEQYCTNGATQGNGKAAPETRLGSGSRRQPGALPGQPFSLNRFAKITVTGAANTGNNIDATVGTEITADQLVTALRQGFAIPITYDEADAFLDHCDVDEKGFVSTKEMAEGIMAGGEGSSALLGNPNGQSAQIENILKNGPNSPHAAFYKASDIFLYLRRKRLGALADPNIRRIILSIKARLLERSIANTRHLAPDSLSLVGSMRSYLVTILTRFPTKLAVTSPEEYYNRLRKLENEAMQRRQQEEAARNSNQQQYNNNNGGLQSNVGRFQYGRDESAYNPTALPLGGGGGGGGGGNMLQQPYYGSSALRYGRPTYTQPSTTARSVNPITNTANINGYGSGPPPPPAPLYAPSLPPNALEQKVIAPEDLLNGLQSLGVRGITMAEITALLKASNTPEGIEPKRLVALLRGPLPRRRRAIIREVFDYIDENKDGILSLEEVMGNFDASSHPAVLIGEATAEEIKRSFMSCWLNDSNGDGAIDWSEFLATYKDMSDEIENDDYFELMMRNCWHLSGGTTALATNTTCRRVLVTFYDGSQRIEEIKNDIGIRPSDKQTMIRRLEQQGCRGVVAVELYG